MNLTLLQVELLLFFFEFTPFMCYTSIMKDINQNFANNLIFFRKRAGLTQFDLASQINYSDKAVSKWERGESIPDVYTLKKLADLFNLTVDSLITKRTEKIELESTIRGFSPLLKKRMNIALLSGALVWLIATISFVIPNIIVPDNQETWKIFVTAIPIFLTVLLVYACIWGRFQTIVLFMSLLAWSIALTSFVLLEITNNWMFFIIPIPIQAIFFLWYRLKRNIEKYKIL